MESNEISRHRDLEKGNIENTQNTATKDYYQLDHKYITAALDDAVKILKENVVDLENRIHEGSHLADDFFRQQHRYSDAIRRLETFQKEGFSREQLEAVKATAQRNDNQRDTKVNRSIADALLEAKKQDLLDWKKNLDDYSKNKLEWLCKANKLLQGQENISEFPDEYKIRVKKYNRVRKEGVALNARVPEFNDFFPKETPVEELKLPEKLKHLDTEEANKSWFSSMTKSDLMKVALGVLTLAASVVDPVSARPIDNAPKGFQFQLDPPPGNGHVFPRNLMSNPLVTLSQDASTDAFPSMPHTYTRHTKPTEPMTPTEQPTLPTEPTTRSTEQPTLPTERTTQPTEQPTPTEKPENEERQKLELELGLGIGIPVGGLLTAGLGIHYWMRRRTARNAAQARVDTERQPEAPAPNIVDTAPQPETPNQALVDRTEQTQATAPQPETPTPNIVDRTEQTQATAPQPETPNQAQNDDKSIKEENIEFDILRTKFTTQLNAAEEKSDMISQFFSSFTNEKMLLQLLISEQSETITNFNELLSSFRSNILEAQQYLKSDEINPSGLSDKLDQLVKSDTELPEFKEVQEIIQGMIGLSTALETANKTRTKVDQFYSDHQGVLDWIERYENSGKSEKRSISNFLEHYRESQDYILEVQQYLESSPIEKTDLLKHIQKLGVTNEDLSKQLGEAQEEFPEIMQDTNKLQEMLSIIQITANQKSAELDSFRRSYDEQLSWIKESEAFKRFEQHLDKFKMLILEVEPSSDERLSGKLEQLIQSDIELDKLFKDVQDQVQSIIKLTDAVSIADHKAAEMFNYLDDEKTDISLLEGHNSNMAFISCFGAFKDLILQVKGYLESGLGREEDLSEKLQDLTESQRNIDEQFGNFQESIGPHRAKRLVELAAKFSLTTKDIKNWFQMTIIPYDSDTVKYDDGFNRLHVPFRTPQLRTTLSIIGEMGHIYYAWANPQQDHKEKCAQEAAIAIRQIEACREFNEEMPLEDLQPLAKEYDKAYREAQATEQPQDMARQRIYDLYKQRYNDKNPDSPLEKLNPPEVDARNYKLYEGRRDEWVHEQIIEEKPINEEKRWTIFENLVLDDPTTTELLRAGNHMSKISRFRPDATHFDDKFDNMIQEKVIWVISMGEEIIVGSRTLSHAVLAGGRPVLAAGEANIYKDTNSYFLLDINNQSGHYCPQSKLPYAIAMFARIGILLG